MNSMAVYGSCWSAIAFMSACSLESAAKAATAVLELFPEPPQLQREGTAAPTMGLEDVL